MMMFVILLRIGLVVVVLVFFVGCMMFLKDGGFDVVLFVVLVCIGKDVVVVRIDVDCEVVDWWMKELFGKLLLMDDVV